MDSFIFRGHGTLFFKKIKNTMLKTISGFPEFLPVEQEIFEQWKRWIADHFARYGFCPQETPAVERIEILTSKGNDHEIYGLCRLRGEDLKTDMGLRFDLTVPLARYVVQHQKNLVFPYRRYQIAPVWRGERAQKGRYRQFYQSDIDIIGKESLSSHADGEVAGIMAQLLEKLPVGPFVFRLNHRAILMAWIQEAGLEAHMFAALRCLDKKDKIGWSAVLIELAGMGAKGEHLAHLEIWHQNSENITPLNAHMDQGLKEMDHAISVMKALGVKSHQIRRDPLLARGLTYYSGMTYEAELLEHKELGTICAGGRYAELATSIDEKSHFPGVGMSLGLSRLFSIFGHKSLEKPKASLFMCMEKEDQPDAFSLAQQVRDAGVVCEMWLEKDVSLSHQLRYAQRKNYSHVLVPPKDALVSDRWSLKDMASGNQQDLSSQELISVLTEWNSTKK